MEQEFHGRGTQSIDRAAQLLVRVLESEDPVTLGDLASAAELPKSTASRLVSALERHGLVHQDGPRGPLVPGPAMLRFAHRGAGERNLVELARASLEALAEGTGETVNLAVPASGGVEHIAQVDGRHFLGTGQWLDRRVDLHCTGAGKLFLAFGAAEPPAGALAAFTPQTITDIDALEVELARVHRQGHATTVDELEPGLTAVAAPVRGHAGDVIAALTISGPTLRLQPRRVAELRPMLIQEARALSRRLGYHHEGEQAA